MGAALHCRKLKTVLPLCYPWIGRVKAVKIQVVALIRSTYSVLYAGRGAKNISCCIHESIDMSSVTIKLPKGKSICEISGSLNIPTLVRDPKTGIIIDTTATAFIGREDFGWTL